MSCVHKPAKLGFYEEMVDSDGGTCNHHRHEGDIFQVTRSNGTALETITTAGQRADQQRYSPTTQSVVSVHEQTARLLSSVQLGGANSPPE